jgi:hypothetical protein
MPDPKEVTAGAEALFQILSDAGYGWAVSKNQCALAARAVIQAVDQVRIGIHNQLQLELDGAHAPGKP